MKKYSVKKLLAILLTLLTIISIPVSSSAAAHEAVSEAETEVYDIPSSFGDINGDGVVNTKDTTRLMRYLAGWDVEVNEAALDVNGDGVVNTKDTTRLMRYLAGWDVDIY